MSHQGYIEYEVALTWESVEHKELQKEFYNESHEKISNEECKELESNTI